MSNSKSVVSSPLADAVRDARLSTHRIEASGLSRRYTPITSIPGADKLPYALRVLLENVVRRAETDDEATRLAEHILHAGLAGEKGDEISFMPARILFQDFTGVPVFVDFAAMRDAALKDGIDPKKINPKIPCTLIIDHSVIADVAGTKGASRQNEAKEVERNYERFAFLKWASKSFDNVEIVPPGSGICHQLNIEKFSRVVTTDALAQSEELACFDTLIGTDSHTTTANGLGILGWGVGGIEAEAAALGQSVSMLVPEVVALKLTGTLASSVSGMDVALSVAELLRREGVVGALVEVIGEGVASLSATQRACIANMTPEYGATTTLFPVDAETLRYLKVTGRDSSELAFVEAYHKAQGTFGGVEGATYARTLTLNLSEIQPSLAGPSRPHDRLNLSELKVRFTQQAKANGHANLDEHFEFANIGSVSHGAIAIAAITSCTTATDPEMTLAAGLLARNARKFGLTVAPWVKTIFGPGSHATELVLKRTGLLEDLEALGFYTCGFGCMSCIGNSGDIALELHDKAQSIELCSVLSGNRNFEGRISPDVSQNYLCQPALVVALALAGTVNIDLEHEPLGMSNGREVYLRDIMPTGDELAELLHSVVDMSLYTEAQEGLFEGSKAWQDIPAEASDTYAWDENSTYIRRAPYFELAKTQDEISIRDARVLANLGDFVTTDHISPAGAIATVSPAATYLREHGIDEAHFNTYGSRRGNHEVMVRGGFANVKLQNKLAEGKRGGWTKNPETGEVEFLFDVAMQNYHEGKDQIILAGKLYGSGSSRDWAAKAPLLLGVRAVIAETFERIHRSNLVQMGVVPLEYVEGESAETLGLDGSETYTIASFSPTALAQAEAGDKRVKVLAQKRDGSRVEFSCMVRVDTPMEGNFLRAGGILPYVLHELR